MTGGWQNTKGLPRRFDGNKQEVFQPARSLPCRDLLPSCSSQLYSGWEFGQDFAWGQKAYINRGVIVTGSTEWSGIFHPCYCLLHELPGWAASLASSHGPPLWCSQGTQDDPAQGTCQAPPGQWKRRQGRQTQQQTGAKRSHERNWENWKAACSVSFHQP